MFVIFLAGGIASGKSTVARELARLGAQVIDLDGLSRQVLEGTADEGGCVAELARAFGEGILRADGTVDRAALASRAFADDDSADLLEAIELPYLRQRLADRLCASPCDLSEPTVVVVEVPLLDRIEDMIPMADTVVAVTAPVALRRERALGRGMAGEDFDARAARQPTADYLAAHADHLIVNDGDGEALTSQVRTWWEAIVVPLLADRGRGSEGPEVGNLDTEDPEGEGEDR